MNINVLSRSPAVQKRMAPPIHDIFRSRKCMISENGSDIRPSITVAQTVCESDHAGSGNGISNDILGSYTPLGSVLDLSAEYMRRAGDDLFLSRVFRAWSEKYRSDRKEAASARNRELFHLHQYCEKGLKALFVLMTNDPEADCSPAMRSHNLRELLRSVLEIKKKLYPMWWTTNNVTGAKYLTAAYHKSKYPPNFSDTKQVEFLMEALEKSIASGRSSNRAVTVLELLNHGHPDFDPGRENRYAQIMGCASYIEILFSTLFFDPLKKMLTEPGVALPDLCPSTVSLVIGRRIPVQDPSLLFRQRNKTAEPLVDFSALFDSLPFLPKKRPEIYQQTLFDREFYSRTLACLLKGQAADQNMRNMLELATSMTFYGSAQQDMEALHILNAAQENGVLAEEPDACGILKRQSILYIHRVMEKMLKSAAYAGAFPKPQEVHDTHKLDVIAMTVVPDLYDKPEFDEALSDLYDAFVSVKYPDMVNFYANQSAFTLNMNHVQEILTRIKKVLSEEVKRTAGTYADEHDPVHGSKTARTAKQFLLRMGSDELRFPCNYESGEEQAASGEVRVRER